MTLFLVKLSIMCVTTINNYNIQLALIIDILDDNRTKLGEVLLAIAYSFHKQNYKQSVEGRGNEKSTGFIKYRKQSHTKHQMSKMCI